MNGAPMSGISLAAQTQIAAEQTYRAWMNGQNAGPYGSQIATPPPAQRTPAPMPANLFGTRPTPEPVRAPLEQRLPNVRLERHSFCGNKDQDPEVFLYQHNLQLSVLGITPGQTSISDAWLIDYVGTALEGPALDWYRIFRADRRSLLSWTEFEQSFVSQFTTGDRVARARDAIHSCKQGKRSVTEYESEFRRLVLQLGSDISEREQMDRYYRGLTSENAVREILMRKPATLRDVMMIARDMESLDKRVSESRGHYYRSHGDQHTSTRSGGASGPTPMELGVIMQENEQLRLQLAQFKGQKPQQRKHNHSRPKLSAEEKERYWKDGLCFGCGKPGHLSKDCPRKLGNDRRAR